MVKLPCSFVVAVRCTPVAVSVMVMFAAGTTAPLASRTVPLKVAVAAVCPTATDVRRQRPAEINRQTTNNELRVRCEGRREFMAYILSENASADYANSRDWK